MNFQFLKDLFTDYKARFVKANLDHIETIRKFREYVDAHEGKESAKGESQYIAIKPFEAANHDYIKKIAAIADSEEMTFLLYDLKQQCVENMVNGNTDVNLQMTGILKGIDLVIKNLSGYKAAWKGIVAENQKNV